MKKASEFNKVYDSVFQDSIEELKERKIFRKADTHLLKEYATEMAFAYILAIKIRELPDSKESTFVRLTRTRKAHLINANQLARTLRLAPMGRQRSGTGEVEEKPKSTGFNIMSLARGSEKYPIANTS